MEPTNFGLQNDERREIGRLINNALTLPEDDVERAHNEKLKQAITSRETQSGIRNNYS